MVTQQLCPSCRSAVPADAPAGLCPKCLLSSARGTPPPSHAGEYEIIEELGRGGMGVVYRARERTPDRIVALKMILAGEFASPSELRRFRDEVDAAGRLEHPNIVKIYDASGVHDGHPFYTMQLVEGGTLADTAVRERFHDPRSAARLIIVIARAVQFGHVHGVLHRDLKPANILVDAEGRPYVTDFGVATVVDRERFDRSEAILGTPEYMSPEQAQGDRDAVTTASDVYALGAVLYELFTGRPPFTARSLHDLLRRIADDQPVAPRRLASGLDRDLETVCLTALEKDPARRYRSAAAFADDLERALDGRPIAALAMTWSGRVARWARRHPLVAAGIGSVGALLLFVTAVAQTGAHSQERELERAVLRSNAFAAGAQAGTVLFQLREYGDRMEQAARSPVVAALIQGQRPPAPAPELERLADGFDNMSVFGADGQARARWPAPTRDSGDYFGKNYSFRDYFEGASRLGREGRHEPYVARAYRSEADGLFKFALSAPVFAADGKWIGAVMAALRTDAAFGAVRMGGGDASESVLLGPRDRERQDAAGGNVGADHLAVLAHDGMRRGGEHTLPPEATAVLHAAFGSPAPPGEQFRLGVARPLAWERHRDPVPGFAGRWLAGVAPVGGTGYVVLVQTRHADAVRPGRTLAYRLSVYAGAPLGAGLVLLGIAAVWATLRRRA
jgi:serine/threonine-protein kinase